MSDANAHPGMDLSSIKALVSQLKIQDLVNAIKTVTMNDIERLSNVARGRELNVDTMKLLFEEATKLHNTGNAMIAIGLVICVILLIFPMAVTTPFLATLGFTSVGPAAASIAATFQSLFGVNVVFSALQSAAMAGYGVPIVAGIVQVASAVGALFASFKLGGGGGDGGGADSA